MDTNETPTVDSPAGSGSWAGEISRAKLEVEKAAATRRGRARDPQPDTGNGRGRNTEQAAELVRELDGLCSPESLEALVQLPGELAAIQTGHDHWPLTDREAKTLSKSGSVLMQQLPNLDTTKLAVLVFGVNFFVIYGKRWFEETRLRKVEAEKRAAEPKA
jgi:hypothetical protein